MRQIDTCVSCGNFTDCFRYRKQWLCEKCPKDVADGIIDTLSELETVAEKPTPHVRRHSKNTGIPQNTYKPKVATKPKTKTRRKAWEPKITMKRAIKEVFTANSDRIFTVKELQEKFPDFGRNSIRNTLIALVNDHSIYSRIINLNGKRMPSIYGCNWELVNQPTNDEKLSMIGEYINENYPKTTKQLMEIFRISDKGLAKIVAKIPNVERYFHKNRNYYFPKNKREICVTMILEF